MRPALVLLMLAAGLLATFLLHRHETRSFDGRFKQAQQRIEHLAREIDEDIARDNEVNQADR